MEGDEKHVVEMCAVIGFLLGFLFWGGLFLIASLHYFSVEDQDHENKRLLIECSDGSTEWVPMPECEGGSS